MEHFTPISSLLGGVLIGLSTASVLILQGRVVGISGICGSLLQQTGAEFWWRLSFVLGLLGVGLLGVRYWPASFSAAGTPPLPLVALGGLLVGFGTRLGNGCTSGHGVCGVSRLSPRSIAATLTFMAAGAATVFVVKQVLHGGG